ncbi:MAG: hypothetical protein WC942_12085 [Clostridia bacterium]|jgi:hypothetical protein
MPDITMSNNTDPAVTELALCESRRVVLYPNQLYRFVVVSGCAECERLAALCTPPTKDNQISHLQNEVAILQQEHSAKLAEVFEYIYDRGFKNGVYHGCK